MNELRQQSLGILSFCFVLALICFFFLDQNVAQYFADPSFFEFRHFCREVTDVAEGSFYLIGAAAVYLSARSWMPRVPALRKNPYLLWNLRRAAGFTLSTLLACGILVHVLKFLFGRQRPHVSPIFADGLFNPFNFHWHWHSFPSGHAQVMFGVATLLSLLSPKFRFPLLSLALAIAMTRVILQQHFLSDIVIGGMIGYLGTLWMFELYWREKLPVDERGLLPPGVPQHPPHN